MSYLVAGKILRIDLSTGDIRTEATAPYFETYVGGRGVNDKLFYDAMRPGTDALGRDNVLVFGVGPLGGTTISSGRTSVVSKSPETGLLGFTNFGGYFGPELKLAGYDHIVITGKSPSPVYLSITDESVELRDAAGLLGRDTWETQVLIRRDLEDPDTQIVTIGPAGEKLVRFACLCHGRKNAAARQGMGAVMGAKGLKAIAVRGTGRVRIGDPQKLRSLASVLIEKVKRNKTAVRFSREGHATWQDEGDAGDSRKRDAIYAGWGGTGQPPMLQRAIYERAESGKRRGCFACPVQCMELYRAQDGGLLQMSCVMYLLMVYGLACHDPAASVEISRRMQLHGLDMVSTTEAIRWLTELTREGIINAEDTDGLTVDRGDVETILILIDKIARREGIGDLLAEGCLAAAQVIGQGSDYYVNHAHGLPMGGSGEPSWVPRVPTRCLAHAVSPSAGNATQSASLGSPEDDHLESPEMVAYCEDTDAIADMLSLCKFIGFHATEAFDDEDFAALLSAGRGVGTSLDELFQAAQRDITLIRVFDLREGRTRASDTLPPRFLGHPIDAGPFKGEVLASEYLEQLKTRYYLLRGWDPKEGVPTVETLKRLSLDWLTDDVPALSPKAETSSHGASAGRGASSPA